MNMEIIKTNKGKEKLCYLGYQYTKQMDIQDGDVL